MAKKSNKTYQIVIQNAEDQVFIKRLLEIYGYQEEEPGIFSEKPVSKPKSKIGTPKLKPTVSTKKVTQKPSSAKPTTSNKSKTVKIKKATTKAVSVKSTKVATKASTPDKATKPKKRT